MTIVRSLVVVPFSYAFMVAFVVVTTAVAIKVLLPNPGREEPRDLPPAYLSANLICAVVAAVLVFVGAWLRTLWEAQQRG